MSECEKTTRKQKYFDLHSAIFLDSTVFAGVLYQNLPINPWIQYDDQRAGIEKALTTGFFVIHKFELISHEVSQTVRAEHIDLANIEFEFESLAETIH